MTSRMCPLHRGLLSDWVQEAGSSEYVLRDLCGSTANSNRRCLPTTSRQPANVTRAGRCCLRSSCTRHDRMWCDEHRVQAEMSLEDLQKELAGSGVLRRCPEGALEDCVAGVPLAAPTLQLPPPLWEVKQALSGDLVLPLSCPELYKRCLSTPPLVVEGARLPGLVTEELHRAAWVVADLGSPTHITVLSVTVVTHRDGHC